MTDKRKGCPMRHENGNCTVAGGFCTAVNDPICEALHNAFDCGYRSAIRARREIESKLKVVESNEPLTLGELRKMDGEPVWVQSPGIPEYGRWAIVEGAGENCLFLHDDFTCHDYGKSWLAYRQKPEEGTV